MYGVGFDEYLYGDGVCLIEWADLIKGLIPKEHTRIEIKKNLEKGLEYRKITVTKSEEADKVHQKIIRKLAGSLNAVVR